jgi:hypothetical protein
MQRAVTARRLAKVRTPFDGPCPAIPQVPPAPGASLRGVHDDAENLAHLIKAVDDAKESLVYLKRLREMYDGRLRAGNARHTKNMRWIAEQRRDDDIVAWAKKRLLDAGPTFYIKERR